MAAITPVANVDPFTILRSAVGTAQTDWIYTPQWASKAYVYLSVTTAGTSTALTLLAGDPAFRDDAQSAAMFVGTTITGAGNHVYVLGAGPGAEAVADAATGDVVVVQGELILPDLLGLTIAATGSTYTLSISFRK